MGGISCLLLLACLCGGCLTPVTSRLDAAVRLSSWAHTNEEMEAANQKLQAITVELQQAEKDLDVANQHLLKMETKLGGLVPAARRSAKQWSDLVLQDSAPWFTVPIVPSASFWIQA